MIQITECPVRHIGQETPQVVRLAELYERGLPPVAGGSLDQSQWFLEAVDFIASVRLEYEAQRVERGS